MLRRFIDLERRKVLSNFIALGLLQGTNFIIPLLILPYIIRIVGFEKFGVIGWVQVIMLYLTIFIDYGFNISATREITLNKNDIGKISEIFSKVYAIKSILLLLSLFIIILLVIVIPQFNEERVTLFLAFTMVIGQALLPIWFFQGIEKMFWLTLTTLISKVSLAVLVLFFIQKEADYIYFLFFFGLGNIIAGLIGIGIAIFSYKIRWKIISNKVFWSEIKDGFSIFISNISIASFMNSNLLILSFFEVDKKIVGYYNTAEKVIFAVWQVLGMFSQAIYPHLCQLATQSHQLLRKFYREIFLPFAVLVFLGCLLLFWQAELVIWLLTGEVVYEIVFLLQLMAIVPFIVVLNIPFYQTLLAYNLKHQYSNIMVLTFFLNIVLGLLLIYLFSAVGTVLNVIMTEILLTLLLFYNVEFAKNKNYNLRITFKNV